jgi:glycosyltransferase involved in cell wall biosynthesis
LGANVRFHGKLGKNELTSLIRSARAVVLPSLWYENAPMGLLEAYALGRPVIASRIGGLPELIREGETGATVPPGDIESLAATMTRFAAAPKVQLAEMGARGRAWVEDEFSEASYLARISNLYASLPGK